MAHETFSRRSDLHRIPAGLWWMLTAAALVIVALVSLAEGPAQTGANPSATPPPFEDWHGNVRRSGGGQ
ncbi:hypothetical protein SAMN05444398_104249 [Roseovarius pacificus]|uniref:Uncharacterized protein n=1 Tax=Roseovarius pacificus TaxID=337701 RepID=A0A1M7CIC3_9RHOB|nr:hypothetical protein [Roseovarius pacificus]GGO55424.1 hypothetical protein GCM10011315_17860 [Roseovarius pacificus]SHL66965.1 hypothetical protein SAMN05444398_104249 [Roseovarius pacificus]